MLIIAWNKDGREERYPDLRYFKCEKKELLCHEAEYPKRESRFGLMYNIATSPEERAIWEKGIRRFRWKDINRAYRTVNERVELHPRLEEPMPSSEQGWQS